MNMNVLYKIFPWQHLNSLQNFWKSLENMPYKKNKKKALI